MDQNEPEWTSLNQIRTRIQIEAELNVETTSNRPKVRSLVYSCLSHMFGRVGRLFAPNYCLIWLIIRPIQLIIGPVQLIWIRKYSNKVYEFKLFPPLC